MRPSRSFARRSLSSPCVRMAEKAHRAGHLALGEQPADEGGGHRLPVHTDLRDAVAAHALCAAELRQLFRVSCAAVAEAEIVAADHVRRMILSQHAL